MHRMVEGCRSEAEAVPPYPSTIGYADGPPPQAKPREDLLGFKLV